MKNIEMIIEKYKKADFEVRLQLFLEYPYLRDLFQKIDQVETSLQPVPEKNAAKSKTGFFQTFSRLLPQH